MNPEENCQKESQKRFPSKVTVHRLPFYLRAVERMKEAGIQITSSKELGEWVGVSAAQIRKDFSQFGEFGKQGTGYRVAFLIEKLREILKVDRTWDIAIVGMGDIGRALVRYKGCNHRGFQVAMLFDNHPEKIGQIVEGFEILDTQTLPDAIREANIKVAILAVPIQEAQETAAKLVEGGVKAILNYAPICLQVPEDVRVEYIDPATYLQGMTYYISDEE